MPTINSREAAEHAERLRQKGFVPQSKYTRPELTEEFVFEWAYIMSQDEMARMFNISRDTLMARFGEQYTAGRDFKKAKRRKQLGDLIDRLAQDDEEYDHRRLPSKTGDLISALNLFAKWNDGMGKPDQAPEPTNSLAALAPEELDALLASLGYVRAPKN